MWEWRCLRKAWTADSWGSGTQATGRQQKGGQPTLRGAGAGPPSLPSPHPGSSPQVGGSRDISSE